MSLVRVNKAAIHILVITTILFILLLTSINIEHYLAPKKVLGAETFVPTKTDVFWQEFLNKNPDYIPGWIEVGRMDKVKEIDPNYKIVSGNQ